MSVCAGCWGAGVLVLGSGVYVFVWARCGKGRVLPLYVDFCLLAVIDSCLPF